MLAILAGHAGRQPRPGGRDLQLERRENQLFGQRQRGAGHSHPRLVVQRLDQLGSSRYDRAAGQGPPGDLVGHAGPRSLGQTDEGRCLWSGVGGTRHSPDGSSQDQESPHRRLFHGRHHCRQAPGQASGPGPVGNAGRHGLAARGEPGTEALCGRREGWQAGRASVSAASPNWR